MGGEREERRDQTRGDFVKTNQDCSGEFDLFFRWVRVTRVLRVCISSAKDRNFHSDGEWLICLERRTGVKMLPSRHFVRLFCWLIGPSSKRSTFTSPTWNVLNILIYDSNLELIWNHRSESDWDRWFKKQSTGESTSFSSPSGGLSDGNVKLWQYSKHSVLNWCWFSLGG